MIPNVNAARIEPVTPDELARLRRKRRLPKYAKPKRGPERLRSQQKRPCTGCGGTCLSNVPEGKPAWCRDCRKAGLHLEAKPPKLCACGCGQELVGVGKEAKYLPECRTARLRKAVRGKAA